MIQEFNIHTWKKFLLRVGILFILLLSIPLQKDYYSLLFTISWEYFIADIFNLVVYLPHYFEPQNSIYDWLLLLAVAIAGAYLWLQKEQQNDPERESYYFYYLRVFVRFKLASILFVAGFMKIFPIFVPDISLSHLNTSYGSFSDWKHLLLSLSAAPSYLVFLGIVELITALLLLFRKTAFLAVIFVIPFYGNAFLADLAYSGPTYFVSVYIVLLTLPIFLYDVPRLGVLIVNLQQTLPATWKFDAVKKNWKITLKLIFSFVFIVLVGCKTYSLYASNGVSLHYSNTAGLPNIEGKYNVESFVINGDTLGYSPVDSVRWKDVVFEKWNTLSVRKVNKSFLDEDSKGFLQRRNEDRDYEYTQVGDRLYYHYHIGQDSTIILKNPNGQYKDDVYNFRIVRPDSAHISLVGYSQNGDSLQVLLRKTDKKYLLHEVKKIGRRGLGYKL